MSSRKALTSFAAVLAAAAVFFATGAAAKPHPTCNRTNSHTILNNAYVRVYGKNGKVYACLHSNGHDRLLKNASPSSDQFALGGKWVGWSSGDPTDPTVPPHSIVTVMYVPNGFINSRWYPSQENETIDKIVVLSDGAAAWAETPTDHSSFSIVRGTDRKGHPADQLSDDHADLRRRSLHVISDAKRKIGWKYVDGTTGTGKLF